MLIRIDKALADMQVGTRSVVKDYIRKKRITVNGKTVIKPETKIDIDSDTVAFDGKVIGYTRFEYYMLNKPSGVVSATKDPGCITVVDLVDNKKRSDLFPVGRLDKDTEGLLLITNDGALAHDLLSPKRHVDKTYYAKVRGKLNDDIVGRFTDGMQVDDEFKALPAKLEIIRYDDENDETEVYVTVHEGKFHQIKRMFLAVDSGVLYLKRVTFGALMLDKNLPVGQYRALTDNEINMLKMRS